MIKRKLEHDTWYWVTHPHEGDVWWPVFINDADSCFMDGKLYSICELEDLTMVKAVMPED